MCEDCEIYQQMGLVGYKQNPRKIMKIVVYLLSFLAVKLGSDFNIWFLSIIITSRIKQRYLAFTVLLCTFALEQK